MISRNIPHLGFIIFSVFMSILLTIVLDFGLLDHELLALLSCLPLLLVPLAIVIGVRFNRSRLVLSSAVMGLLIYLFCYAAPGPWFNRGLNLAQVLTPIYLGVLVWKRERGLFTSPGISWTAGSLFIWGVPVALWIIEPSQFTEFMYPIDEFITVNQSWIYSGAITLGCLSCFIAYLVHQGVMEITMFFIAIINFMALKGAGDNDYNSVTLFSFSLALSLAGLLELSHYLAFKDELTGLPGRRALMEDLAKLGHSYSLAMSDIDHFKKFNDTYGHDTGDLVLRKVAQQLAFVGGGGTVYRYGGEEFTIVFSGISSHEAAKYLDEVRQAIADRPLEVVKPAKGKNPAKECSVKITISIGVTEPDNSMNNPMLVLKGADKALYMAKKNGRNRVVDLHGPVVTETSKKSSKVAVKKRISREMEPKKVLPNRK